jgi:hypothetical protein
VVDDYTMDYGAKSFTVFRDYITSEKLDLALLNFADRVDPGRRTERTERLERSPSDLGDRIEHHIRLLVRVLYRSIAPARLVALNEMYLLAEGASGDAEIRSRINAYLGEGSVGVALAEAIHKPGRIDLDEVIDGLDGIEVEDRFEWAGAAARQLEETPNHPIALFVAALAQCLLPNSDRERVEELLHLTESAITGFQVTDEEAGSLFNFGILFLHRALGGIGRDHVLALWGMVLENMWTCDDLQNTETWLLENPAEAGIGELDAVVFRRMTLINDQFNLLVATER